MFVLMPMTLHTGMNQVSVEGAMTGVQHESGNVLSEAASGHTGSYDVD